MISCGQQSDHTAPSSFSLVLSLVLRHLAKNRKKNSLLALPNPTPKSRNQAMHVTPPRSPSQELSIVLQDCRWCGVSEEIEEGWSSWPPQQFPLACSSKRLAPEQQASHAGSKSARQQRAPEQQAHAGAASRVGVASARQPRMPEQSARAKKSVRGSEAATAQRIHREEDRNE